MRTLKNYIAFVLLVLLLVSCSQHNDLVESNGLNEPTNSKFSIPDSIITKSNFIIASKVGQAFFNSYITLDSVNSKFVAVDTFYINNPAICESYRQNPYYYMKYKFQMDYFGETGAVIDFVLDSSGALISGTSIYGIPKCTSNNCLNNFPVVSKERAIEIAKGNGLEIGIKDWEIKLIFDTKYADYFWHITNTLEINNSSTDGYNSKGKGIKINAIDEKFFELFSWSAMS